MIAPADVLAPAGVLEQAMFPGLTPEQIDARLDAWITESTGKTAGVPDSERDDARKAWVYYRGFKSRAIQLASEPAQTTVPNEIGTGRTDLQRLFFEEEAARWLAEFEAFLPEDEDVDQGHFPATGSTPNVYRW